MQIYRYMCIKNKLQITVHKIFKRIDNCMTKTSVIKYRKLFPLCLNLSHNKCLSSLLRAWAIRPCGTTRFHIQTNEVSHIFFTSLGSNEGWKISIQTNFLNLAGNLVQLGALF